jgi:hypothetical protein
VVEDNPYGDLWFDAPPPPPLTATLGDAAVYLGSFSKVLAPGLRLGYVVAPKLLYPKLLQAKQAADLHTPGFNQRVVYEVIKDGFLRPACADHPRALQGAARRDALGAGAPTCPAAAAGACRWAACSSGSSCRRHGCDRAAAQAVDAGVAYVPGRGVLCRQGACQHLRLSFVTVPPERITQGVAALGRVLQAGTGMKRRFHQVDVFSAVPLKGNPLAVVHTADGLGDDTMAAFARWTNLSETTFLLPPTEPGADYRVRIFTPFGELPFAGHPTLGSCWAWLAAGGQAQRADEVVQQCAVGLVRIRRQGQRLAFAAPPTRRSGPLEADRLATIRRALGLAEGDVLQHQWVDNGPGWGAVMLRSAEAVRALHVDWAVLGDIKLGVVGPQAPGATRPSRCERCSMASKIPSPAA